MRLSALVATALMLPPNGCEVVASDIIATDETQLDADKGRRLYESGYYIEAIEHYSGLIEENPTSVENRCRLGACYSGSGHYKQALLEYEESLVYATTKKQKGLIHASIAAICKKSAQHKRAVDAWNEAIDCCPEELDFRLGLCVGLAELGDWNGCNRHAEELIASIEGRLLSEDTARTMAIAEALRSKAVTKLDSIDAGLQLLTRAYKKQPKSRDLCIAYIRTVSEYEEATQSDLDNAVSAVRTIQRLQDLPSQPRGQLAIGTVLLRAGERDEGLAILEEVASGQDRLAKKAKQRIEQLQ